MDTAHPERSPRTCPRLVDEQSGERTNAQVLWPAMQAPVLQHEPDPPRERAPIQVERDPPTLTTLDMTLRVKSKVYVRELETMQRRLQEVAVSYLAEDRKAVVVFEGSDAAGKGGAIRRMSWPLDPRTLKVWPIAAPTPEEKAQHYLYRFWKRLPRPGQIVVFDRSWYGRVLVERIEGFASEAEWRRAYDEINEFERMLHDDGIRLVKIFLHITAEKQLARFRARFRDPVKRWRVSEEDLRNRDRWDDYIEATEEMFRKTSTVANPWTVIPSNNKKYSRLKVIDTVVQRMAAGVEISPPALDPAFEARLRAALGL